MTLLLLSLSGVVPRQSWLRSPWVLFPAIPGWGLVYPLPGVVPYYSWVRFLFVLFPASLGWGLLLSLLRLVPCHSWLRSLWVHISASLGWGLLLSVSGLVPRLSWLRSLWCVGGVCGCVWVGCVVRVRVVGVSRIACIWGLCVVCVGCACCGWPTPFLAGAYCSCFRGGGPLPFLATGFLGVVPCRSRLRSLWVWLSAFSGQVLLLSLSGWSLARPG